MYDYSYYSYDYPSYSGSSGGILAALAGVGLAVWIVGMAISVLMIISMWMIFKKNGKAGWIAIIPFYNMWTFFEICDIHGWMIFIPFANIIFMFIAYYRIAIKMGKSSGFGVLCIFFPEICLPILAFSKGGVVANQAPVENYQPPVNNPQPVEPTVTPQVTPTASPTPEISQQPVTEIPSQPAPEVAPVQDVVTPVEQTPEAGTTVVIPTTSEPPVTPQAPAPEAAVETLDEAASQNEGFKFCTNCGNKCASNMKFCDNCGKEF